MPRDAGETGVIGGAGRQWLSTARLLCDCLAIGLQAQPPDAQQPRRTEAPQGAAAALDPDGGDGDPPFKRRRVTDVADTSRSARHAEQPAARTDAGEDSHLHVNAGKVNCAFEQLPAWHHSPTQLQACQQAWHALTDTVRTSRVSRDGCAPTAEIAGRDLELLHVLGRTAGLSRPAAEVLNMAESQCVAGAEVEHEGLMSTLEQAVAKELSGCTGARVRRLQSLALAAAHAVSRATALLALCVGPTHTLREVNAFASCFGRLPWVVASAIVAAANDLSHVQH